MICKPDRTPVMLTLSSDSEEELLEESELDEEEEDEECLTKTQWQQGSVRLKGN